MFLVYTWPRSSTNFWTTLHFWQVICPWPKNCHVGLVLGKREAYFSRRFLLGDEKILTNWASTLSSTIPRFWRIVFLSAKVLVRQGSDSLPNVGELSRKVYPLPSDLGASPNMNGDSRVWITHLSQLRSPNTFCLANTKTKTKTKNNNLDRPHTET